VDGSSLGKQGRPRIGGVIRDHKRSFHLQFFNNKKDQELWRSRSLAAKKAMKISVASPSKQ